MKVIILAGGLPSTLIEQSERIPKPMAEIGGRPILWHIMKRYAAYGFNDFIICGGYKIDVIKEYFMNFYYHQSDITVDLSTNEIVIHRKETENWKVTVIDTGLKASISERITKVWDYLDGEDFWVAYGDCVSNIDFRKMYELHCAESKMATLAVVRPSGRNQILPITANGFSPQAKVEDVVEDAWINGCNMIFSAGAKPYMEEHKTIEHVLFDLGNNNELSTYKHKDFWSSMETVRERDVLDRMWRQNNAPWKIWE